MMRRLWLPLLRWLGWVLLAGVALQVFFFLHVVSMLLIDPVSTTFQRSEAWRLAQADGPMRWSHRWVPYENLSPQLKRAVIASEDANFIHHGGVDWDAIEQAWATNAYRRERAERRAARTGQPVSARPPRIVGGSTISQQLAKNLWLSGERTLLRKGQELVLTLMLEAVLSKERILDIYLNSVEWGSGVFGAEAAAQRYFRKPAQRLTAHEAARLAVMLPAPKLHERRLNSSFLAGRTATIQARMGDVTLP